MVTKAAGDTAAIAAAGVRPDLHTYGIYYGRWALSHG
jgi:hypothetical protein